MNSFFPENACQVVPTCDEMREDLNTPDIQINMSQHDSFEEICCNIGLTDYQNFSFYSFPEMNFCASQNGTDVDLIQETPASNVAEPISNYFPPCQVKLEVDTRQYQQSCGAPLSNNQNVSGYNEAYKTEDRCSMKLYRELILHHVVQDINITCSKLQISYDPMAWSSEDTFRWVEEIASQFQLGAGPWTQLYVPGHVLCQMSPDHFLMVANQAGETLHAQLQIWRTAAEYAASQTRTGQPTQEALMVEQTQSCFNPQLSPADDQFLSNWLDSIQAANDNEHSTAVENSSTGISTRLNALSYGGPPLHSPSSDSGMSTDNEECNMQQSRPEDDKIGGKTTIHLWQFIRELLDDPKNYNQCVKWINRSEGTFKIEDSHRLARLWGQRKNRHKMNYDKLSRSLRQYYKKNIMRKTGQKQRLIYQFIAPYHVL